MPASAPVTAAASTADNATPPNPQITAPQETRETEVTTGAGEDDNFGNYEAEKAAFLSGKTTNPAPAAPAPAAPTSTPPANPPQATAQPPQDEDDVPLIGADGRMPKMRVRTVTPVDVRAIAEFQASQKAGNTQSFVEFVQERYPVTQAPPAGGDTGNPADPPPATVAAVDAQLKQLKQDRYTAMEEFDFARARQIEEQEEQLREQREELQLQEMQGLSEQQQKQQEAAMEYLQKAAQMFPQAVKADDPLVIEARAVLSEWEATGDPRAAHPSANLYCYVEAAHNLGIQPSTSSPVSQSQSSPPPPVVNRKPPVSAIIAGGSASTTQQIQAAPKSYEEEKREFLQSDFGRRRQTAAA